MFNTSISETFTLPSRGEIYSQKVNPQISLRSMTTLEEMKRTNATETPYKVMCDIIEDCMKEKPAVHVYDMCLGDYQFLLHKLRIVTYGPEYKMLIKCEKCGEVTESIANLESLEVHEYDPSITEKMRITLPRTNKVIDLKFQTPRSLDQIAYLSKEMKKKTKQNLDYSIMYTLISLIDKVDGQELETFMLEDFVKNLPNMDANYILHKASEIANLIGLDNMITIKCAGCGKEIKVPFRITPEFLGPTIY